jgi:hypothetical protein
MTADSEPPLCALSPADLRTALITRADAITHHLGTDTENTRWLACVVAVHGWPDRHLVQDDGALAALLLAARAPIDYQATWRAKLVSAIRAGTVDTQTAGALLESIAAKRGAAA